MRFKEIQKHYEYLILNIEDLVYDTDNIIDLLNKYLYSITTSVINKKRIREIEELIFTINGIKLSLLQGLELSQDFDKKIKREKILSKNDNINDEEDAFVKKDATIFDGTKYTSFFDL